MFDMYMQSHGSIYIFAKIAFIRIEKVLDNGRIPGYLKETLIKGIEKSKNFIMI